jgi:hypothetical protein
MPRSKKSKSKTRSRAKKFVKELNSRVKRLSKNLRKLSKRRRIVIQRRSPSPSPIRLRFNRTPVRLLYGTPLFRRFRYGTPLYRRGTPVHHYHYNNAPAANVPARAASPRLRIIKTPAVGDISTPAIKLRARQGGFEIDTPTARDQRRGGRAPAPPAGRIIVNGVLR